MVDDAGAQGEAAMNRRVGQEYLSSTDHALQNLLVQRVAIGVSIAPRSIAEADCDEWDGSQQCEFGLLRNEPGQQLRVRQIVADRLPKVCQSVVAQRQPKLQRAKASRQLDGLL